MTNYNKNNLAVVTVASKNSFKPELNAVAFYGDRTVATDSFRLIEMSVENGYQTKELKDPVIIKRANVDRVKLKKDETIVLDDLRSGTIDGTYPKYTELFDAAEKRDSVEFTVSATYLAEVVKILGKLSPTDAVKISVPKEMTTHAPIVVRSGNVKTGQSARALVMPMLK